MIKNEKSVVVLRRVFSIMVLSLLVIQLFGCAAAVVGAGVGVGTYAYVSGKLTYSFDRPVLAVHGATVKALKHLKLPIIEDKSDSVSAVLKSKFADGDDINIDIKAQSERSSTIAIRVGVFGDEKKSLIILDEIKKKH
ncbi:MAG: DUF3568 family protein [Nitrospirae bacterium]|nr:DUF3568 family protein [Nitrospirota bacterium]